MAPKAVVPASDRTWELENVIAKYQQASIAAKLRYIGSNRRGPVEGEAYRNLIGSVCREAEAEHPWMLEKSEFTRTSSQFLLDLTDGITPTTHKEREEKATKLERTMLEVWEKSHRNPPVIDLFLAFFFAIEATRILLWRRKATVIGIENHSTVRLKDTDNGREFVILVDGHTQLFTNGEGSRPSINTLKIGDCLLYHRMMAYIYTDILELTDPSQPLEQLGADVFDYFQGGFEATMRDIEAGRCRLH